MTERLRELLAAGGITAGPWKADIGVFAADPPYHFDVTVEGGRGPLLSMLFVSETDVLNEVTQESSQRAKDSQPGRDAAYIAACDPGTIRELLDAHDRMAGALAAAKAMERVLILFVAQAHLYPDLAREGIAALRAFQALAVPKEETP